MRPRVRTIVGLAWLVAILAVAAVVAACTQQPPAATTAEPSASAESDAERARIERISSTPAPAMHAVLEAIDRDYGGAEQYLLDGGLAPDTLAAARSRLRPA